MTKQLLIQIHNLKTNSLDVSQSGIIQIKDIMTQDVVTLESHCTIRDAAKIMVENNISSMIITENKEPVGILREKDILSKVASKDTKFSNKVSEIMSNTLIYADPEQTVWEVIELMKSRKMNSIPVISHKSEILGTVKFTDFLKAFSFD